jgi:hypothetical protein
VMCRFSTSAAARNSHHQTVAVLRHWTFNRRSDHAVNMNFLLQLGLADRTEIIEEFIVIYPLPECGSACQYREIDGERQKGTKS